MTILRAVQQCCAIDYILHTLDSATALLNSPRAFPSRCVLTPFVYGAKLCLYINQVIYSSYINKALPITCEKTRSYFCARV